jgi:hypothetical protein
MNDKSPYIPTLSASDISIRLNERLVSIGKSWLKGIHVIPSELTENKGWYESGNEDVGQQELNELLGRLATDFIARELTNTLMVNQYDYDTKTRRLCKRPIQEKNVSGEKVCGREKGTAFRIGLATGSTIFQLVDSLDVISVLCSVDIAPLVIGPVPETRYSAGFIADLFVRRFRAQEPARINLLNVGKITYQTSVTKDARKQQFIAIQLFPECSALRDNDKPTELGKGMADYFDWVVTGIGAWGKGQLDVHVNKIYATGDKPTGVVGDVCSRPFDHNGKELPLTKATSDMFVAISFEAMEKMCTIQGKGKRVIAIAGGKEKYAAIRTLLVRDKPLFNVLVTDELTARRLLVDLE